MENFDETKPFATENEEITLIVTEDIRSHVYETAKWAKFLSIVGFVFSVIMVLYAFVVPSILAAMSALGSAAVFAKLGAGILVVLFLLFALLYFYPSLLLFKYASAAKKATLYGDQLSLSVAMSKMKSFFKFWGILTIILISINVIFLLFGIVAGIGAGMGS